MGLDRRQTGESTGNYAESDLGRVGHEAGFRKMGSETEEEGPVDNRKFCGMAPTETGKDNRARLLRFSMASWWKAQQSPRWDARVERHLSANLRA
jgi:hypothetical protein